MKFQGITRVVKDVQASKKFYEDILGFTPGASYDPTHWQAYPVDGVYYAVGEAPGSHAETGFLVEDVAGLYEKIKDQVRVVEPLERKPWGSYKFVIEDPDGYLLAFVQQEQAGE